jgi:hypothetical protein
MSNSTTKKSQSQILPRILLSSPDKQDAIAMVAQFKKTVLEDRNHLFESMRDDIRMSSLKIRPFLGDVFQLNMANPKFISALWKLIKIDQFIADSQSDLPSEEYRLLENLMNQLREKVRIDINKIDLRLPHLKNKGTRNLVTMEIYKESPLKRRRKTH